jgi:hypothetical protein
MKRKLSLIFLLVLGLSGCREKRCYFDDKTCEPKNGQCFHVDEHGRPYWGDCKQ